MKPTVLYSAIAALAGFALAWVVKPTPETMIVREKSPPKRESAAPRRPSQLADPMPNNSAPDRPPSAGIESAPIESATVTRNRQEAKMARLAELLGLSKEQQESLDKILIEARATIFEADGTPEGIAKTLATATAAGETIQKSLAALFTPEQAAAFEALRERTFQNTVETTAQAQLSTTAKDLDLSPEQRAKALAALRDSVQVSLKNRPAALTLALDNPILPDGAKGLSTDVIESLQRTASSGNDPSENQLALIETQRRNLDAELEIYRGILSPAQLAQLKLNIDERKQALDRVGSLLR